MGQLPYGKIQSGTLTATASTPMDITISSMAPPTYFEMKNITKWGATTTAQDIEFWWQEAMAQGTANGIHQASGGAGSQTLNAFTLASDGISTYNLVTPPTFAPLACTAVTRGSANGVTVVSMTNTGTIGVGDRVYLYNVAGMQQISGLDFQVVAVSANTSITIDLDSSAFGADGTTGQVVKYIAWRYYPRYSWISSISKANPCVVNVTIDSDFTVGEEVSFRVPTGISTMSQIQNMKGVVTAVTAATATTCSQVTVNIDTSGFTTFALPTSAQAAAGVSNQPAMLVPAGSGVVPNQSPPGTNLLDAFDNKNKYVIHLGATVFANTTTGSVWQWTAYQADEYNGQ